mmetsp:Transcript_22850/g.30459  ORF Transcript_22850/g.30459 Transcript_22850/m.30459 type:complete len:96 (+) Transcript_22850:666-953(+)
MDVHAGQVIQEFKVCVEDTRMAPFEQVNFLKLASFRDFSYRSMSASLIVTFLNKRFDLAEPSESHPPLTMDQMGMRDKLVHHLAKFEQSAVASSQ